MASLFTASALLNVSVEAMRLLPFLKMVTLVISRRVNNQQRMREASISAKSV
jgi:hypothetical protein